MNQKFTGEVTKLRHAKTVTVKVARTELHPKYHKPIKKEKDYKVHNEGYDLKLGDKVVIESCRPRSKTKRFLVIEKKGINPR
jgi:small subunit ribosomal protein S17